MWVTSSVVSSQDPTVKCSSNGLRDTSSFLSGLVFTSRYDNLGLLDTLSDVNPFSKQ